MPRVSLSTSDMGRRSSMYPSRMNSRDSAMPSSPTHGKVRSVKPRHTGHRHDRVGFVGRTVAMRRSATYCCGPNRGHEVVNAGTSRVTPELGMFRHQKSPTTGIDRFPLSQRPFPANAKRLQLVLLCAANSMEHSLTQGPALTGPDIRRLSRIRAAVCVARAVWPL